METVNKQSDSQKADSWWDTLNEWEQESLYRKYTTSFGKPTVLYVYNREVKSKETQPTTNTEESSTGHEVVEQKDQMTGLDWYNAYKESNSLFIKAMEGAVIMKEEHTDLYNALTGLYKTVLTCRDNKQALADALFAIKRANPSYSQQDHLTS